MTKTILYPFRIDHDFRMGYAWSAELARRLKGRLSLFTTVTEATGESLEEVYHSLADAQGFYVKNFQLLQLRLKPVRSERNFLKGEFLPTFRDFVNHDIPHILVLPSPIFPSDVIKEYIAAGQPVAVLPSIQNQEIPTTRRDRSQWFIGMLKDVALYNVPASFFVTISEDQGLFNSIAAFFRK
jgi:hypothetical protein